MDSQQDVNCDDLVVKDVWELIASGSPNSSFSFGDAMLGDGDKQQAFSLHDEQMHTAQEADSSAPPSLPSLSQQKREALHLQQQLQQQQWEQQHGRHPYAGQVQGQQGEVGQQGHQGDLHEPQAQQLQNLMELNPFDVQLDGCGAASLEADRRKRDRCAASIGSIYSEELVNADELAAVFNSLELTQLLASNSMASLSNNASHSAPRLAQPHAQTHAQSYAHSPSRACARFANGDAVDASAHAQPHSRESAPSQPHAPAIANGTPQLSALGAEPRRAHATFGTVADDGVDGGTVDGGGSGGAESVCMTGTDVSHAAPGLLQMPQWPDAGTSNGGSAAAMMTPFNLFAVNKTYAETDKMDRSASSATSPATTPRVAAPPAQARVLWNAVLAEMEELCNAMVCDGRGLEPKQQLLSAFYQKILPTLGALGPVGLLAQQRLAVTVAEVGIAQGITQDLLPLDEDEFCSVVRTAMVAIRRYASSATAAPCRSDGRATTACGSAPATARADVAVAMRPAVINAYDTTETTSDAAATTAAATAAAAAAAAATTANAAAAASTDASKLFSPAPTATPERKLSSSSEGDPRFTLDEFLHEANRPSSMSGDPSITSVAAPLDAAPASAQTLLCVPCQPEPRMPAVTPLPPPASAPPAAPLAPALAPPLSSTHDSILTAPAVAIYPPPSSAISSTQSTPRFTAPATTATVPAATFKGAAVANSSGAAVANASGAPSSAEAEPASTPKLHACKNCQRAKTACIDQRPCPRCVRLSIPCDNEMKALKRACANCKRAKVKCDLDDEFPCKRCKRLGVQCAPHVPNKKKRLGEVDDDGGRDASPLFTPAEPAFPSSLTPLGAESVGAQYGAPYGAQYNVKAAEANGRFGGQANLLLGRGGGMEQRMGGYSIGQSLRHAIGSEMGLGLPLGGHAALVGDPTFDVSRYLQDRSHNLWGGAFASGRMSPVETTAAAETKGGRGHCGQGETSAQPSGVEVLLPLRDVLSGAEWKDVHETGGVRIRTRRYRDRLLWGTVADVPAMPAVAAEGLRTLLKHWGSADGLVQSVEILSEGGGVPAWVDQCACCFEQVFRAKVAPASFLDRFFEPRDFLLRSVWMLQGGVHTNTIRPTVDQAAPSEEGVVRSSISIDVFIIPNQVEPSSCLIYSVIDPELRNGALMTYYYKRLVQWTRRVQEAAVALQRSSGW